MEYREFRLRELRTSAEGVFTGDMSVFNKVDSYGSYFVPGAFKRTLDSGVPIPILFQHDRQEIIGLNRKAEERATGVAVEGEVFINSPARRADEAWFLMQKGVLWGLSFGFNTIKDLVDDKGLRRIEEVRLFEYSPVAWPAQERAKIKKLRSTPEFVAVLDMLGDGFDGDLAGVDVAKVRAAREILDKLVTTLGPVPSRKDGVALDADPPLGTRSADPPDDEIPSDVLASMRALSARLKEYAHA
jgi:HK97 family phage prohead protease